MVSIKTILTLGALAVGVTLFFGLGGASGIGTRIGSTIGSGLRTFGESLTESFTSGLLGILNPFATTGGNEPAPSPTRPDPTCGPGTTENALGVCVAAEMPPSERSPIPEPIPLPRPTPGTPIIASGLSALTEVVSPSFLERFSFQPPVQTFGVLDVTKSLSYLAADGVTPREAQVAKLIEANSKLFPSFFG